VRVATLSSVVQARGTAGAAAPPYPGTRSGSRHSRLQGENAHDAVVLSIETYMSQRAGLPPRCIMKLSARNQLPGKVKAVNEGVVTAEVVITLDGGGELISVITKKSVENLGIAVGKKVYAVVKSTEVMVATD